MTVWKLLIEYDGTRYHGWQEQKSARTVAGEVRKAAEDVFQSPVELSGAGRTDAGVHALGQVARLKAPPHAKPRNLQYALNDRLPPDIHVLRVKEVAATFNPRYDAVARYYIYQLSRRRSAFAKKYVWWVKDRLNVEVMNQAAALFVGRHDFAAFCEPRTDEKSTLVEVERVELVEEGDLLLFRIGASHFLWKMVRRIVGALVSVGRGKIAARDVAELLRSPAREAGKIFDVAANTAPPSGLFLERVVYAGEKPPDRLAAVTPVGRYR